MAALFLLLLLCFCSAAISSGDPGDERCLSALYRSLNSPSSLRNWSAASFASPCTGFISYLQGVTCNNGRVYKLQLPSLSLSGDLPAASLSNCSNLQTLDLSANAISGPIPSDISLLLNLAVLNLSANALSGPIPPDLALCAYLNVIDLHANQLSGPIPEQLGLLVRLSILDVSDNRLSGPIPALLANRSSAAGIPRFNVSSFLGNKDLYGYPLPPKQERGLSVPAIVGIGLGSGFLSLILSFAAVCVWLKATERSRAAAAAASTAGEEGKISHLMPDY